MEQIGALPIEWKLSQKGNPYANLDKWNLVVFRRDKKRWGYRTQRRSPTLDPSCTVSPYSIRYNSLEEAQEACIKSIEDLTSRLGETNDRVVEHQLYSSVG